MKKVNFFFITRTIGAFFMVSWMLGCEKSPDVTKVENVTKTTEVTIGSTDIGSALDMVGPDFINADKWQATSSMVATKMYVYVANQVEGKKIKCAIYSDGTDGPATLLGETNERTNPGTGWQKFTLSTSVSIVYGTYYWLAMWTDGEFLVKTEISEGTCWFAPSKYASGWPSLMSSGSTGTYVHSLYASGTTGTH